MTKPKENTFLNHFMHPFRHSAQLPYPYIGTPSILLIRNKPFILSICTALILDLSSFHNIVSLPYVRTGTSKVSCKNLAHSSCKPLTLTRDLIAPLILLPLSAFLRHSASSEPDSSRTHPKYLSSDTCYSGIPSTRMAHSSPSSRFNTITLLLPELTFRPSLLHTNKTFHHCS